MVLPCPQCCHDCVIGVDLFDGDDSLWTASGTFTVADGALTMDGPAEGLFQHEPATANDPVKVTINAAGGGMLRIIVAREDVDNYLFGEVSISGGVGFLRVGQVVGGSEEYLTDALEVEDEGADLEASHRIELCFNPGQTREPESGSHFRLPQVVVGDNWTTPGKATVEDDDPAEWTFTASGTADVLVAGGWSLRGFIPPGSTIDGILASASLRVVQLGSGDPPVVSAQFHLGTGTALGDPINYGTIAVGTSYNVIGVGSASSDPWNASPTWQDVTDTSFAVAVTFGHSSGAPARVDVDWIGVEVHYTTPERTSGRLQLTWRNVGGEQETQCAMSHRFFAQALGTGSGLEAVSGEWEIDDYKLEYARSQTRPACPVCDCPVDLISGCDCSGCDEGVPSLLALGEFLPLTPDPCAACGEVDGTYVLFNGVDGSCDWGYEEQLTTCVIEELSRPMFVRLAVWMENDPGTFNCRWHAVAVLAFEGGTSTVDPSNPDSIATPGGLGVVARYRSAVIGSEDCPILPATLDRYDFSEGNVCTGEWPETLDLESAV